MDARKEQIEKAKACLKKIEVADADVAKLLDWVADVADPGVEELEKCLVALEDAMLYLDEFGKARLEED